MKARLKFSKVGSMRFIGHLDVMRYFQKAFRRANVEISYSQGYSPHQLMSFASPLGIGLSSDGEYLDIVLNDGMNTDNFIRQVNSQMNDEIEVKDFTILSDESKTSMAVLAACDYLVCVKSEKDSFLLDENDRKKSLLDIKNAEKIQIVKKTKRSEKLVDIKENIYMITDDLNEFENYTGIKYDLSKSFLDEYTPVLYMQLTAGSIVNIKPELVLEAIYNKKGLQFNWTDFQIHRLEMYGDNNMVKGEIHTLSTEVPCDLVSLSEYGKR